MSLAASTLLVIPVYQLSRELHGRPAAVLSAITISIWPWLADYGCRVGPDALGCTLWFSAVWLFVCGLRRNWLWMLPAAAAFFALHLARNEGTYIWLAALPAALIICGKKDRRRLLALLPFALVSAGLLLLYAAYMKRVVGTATVSYPSTYMIETHLAAHKEIAKTFLKLFGEAIPVMLGPVLLLFAGVGFFERSEEQPRDMRLESAVLFFAAAQFSLAVLNLSPAPRYVMALIIVVSLWSARGMAHVSTQLRATTQSRVVAALPVVALIAVMMLGTAVALATEHMGERPREPREYKEAGLWMKTHLEPGPIVSRKPQVGFYAGMTTVGVPADDSLSEIIAWGKEAGARYLVVDERYTAKLVPALRALLDPPDAPKDLTLLYDATPYPAARVVIYEILQPGEEAGP